jgi:hypothetical protein
MRISGVVLMLCCAGACRADVSCYRTAKQAAVQVGEQDGGGYRLEYVRWDPLGGRGWASVRSCAHPEWPAVMVPADAVDSHLSDDKAVAKVGHMDVVRQMEPVGRMDVMGGSLVHVVMADSMVRMEMSGVAQASGRLGDRIQVRILGPADGGEERVLDAVIRSAEFVEVVR